jgi:hypothetical protein
MKVTLVSPNRMAILADCTVAQAQAAFSVQLKNFQGSDRHGLPITFRANTSPVTVPDTISNVIVNVGGLDDYYRPQPRTILAPSQARTCYNTAPSYGAGIQGQGRKIGYSNWDNVSLSDANTYVTNFGLPVPAAGIGTNVHVVVVGAGHNMVTPGGEGNLDLQMELAAAPLADIYIYDNSTNDLLGVLTREASDNLCQIISESYGWSASIAYFASCHNQHLAMTAQGMTYVVASGDQGTTDLSSDPYPDVDPEVTNVGGTVATTDGSGLRTSELAWGLSGGGWSTTAYTYNVLPSWQVGTGVPTGNNHRLVPDISLHASSSTSTFTSAFYFYAGGLAGASGTSCSSPYFASSLATMQQRLLANGWTSNARMGRINNLIYSENGRADVWLDITSGGSSGLLPDSTTASPHAGWDFVTGFGPPNFDAWYNVLSTKTVSGTVTLGGYAASTSGVGITVQIYNAGTSTLVDTKTTTLNGSGGFSVATQAPVGSYDIYVKASHWLRKVSTSQSLSTTGVSGLSFSLVNADINGDNAVTLADFGALKLAYGSTSVDSNWNPNADLNGDGAVTLADFAILKLNYGQIGN